MLAAGGIWLVWFTIVRQPEMGHDLAIVKSENEATKREMSEYSKHLGETPDAVVTLVENALGKITVTHYRDNCLLPAAFGADGTLLAKALIIDITKPAKRPISFIELGKLLETPVVAQQQTNCDRFQYNHGQFREQPMGQNGCFIGVRRFFQDGCWHDQAFDACRRIWLPPVWGSCRH